MNDDIFNEIVVERFSRYVCHFEGFRFIKQIYPDKTSESIQKTYLVYEEKRLLRRKSYGEMPLLSYSDALSRFFLLPNFDIFDKEDISAVKPSRLHVDLAISKKLFNK